MLNVEFCTNNQSQYWHMTLQLDIVRKVQYNDKVLQIQQPTITDIQPEQTDEQPQEQTTNEQDTQQEQHIEPLRETTGDTDLDLLLYNNNIYQ